MPNLDRQADCPSCGATVTFKFAGARSLVCDYCRAVVARTDRGLTAQGRMADLLEIPSPLAYQASGKWKGEPFEVIGRVQMDRAGAPGAPWQEILVWFSQRDTTTWVAQAQGRWYATNEVKLAGPPPGVASLRPGAQVDLGQHGLYVVQEVGQRRVVSGEGSLPDVPKPGVVTRYADISGPQQAFGTIDYGDGSAPPVVFLGRQFDPREIQLDTGMPVVTPQAKVSACDCPNCGASLPIVNDKSERVICQYCGTASDLEQGHLRALGPAPRPPIPPYVPIGARGNVRGQDYIVCGFVIRSCMVDGTRYSWREYLLFGGDAAGYRWLMEEDGVWTWVIPIEVGDVAVHGAQAVFQGNTYRRKQSVRARVDYVIGEFYWKLEIGETVKATEYAGPGGKISQEEAPTEVTFSFVSPLNPHELSAFGVRPPAAPMFSGSGGGGTHTQSNPLAVLGIVVLLIVVLMVMSAGSCASSGYSGTSGSGSFGSGSFGK